MKLPQSYWCVVDVVLQNEKCYYPQNGRGEVEWTIDRISARLKEKK